MMTPEQQERLNLWLRKNSVPLSLGLLVVGVAGLIWSAERGFSISPFVPISSALSVASAGIHLVELAFSKTYRTKYLVGGVERLTPQQVRTLGIATAGLMLGAALALWIVGQYDAPIVSACVVSAVAVAIVCLHRSLT